MEMLRLGSLDLLVRTGTGSLRTWIDGKLPSADTLDHAAESLHADDIRGHVLQTYFVMRRGKNIRTIRGHRHLVLDGHELFCRDRRHLGRCAQEGFAMDWDLQHAVAHRAPRTAHAARSSNDVRSQ